MNKVSWAVVTLGLLLAIQTMATVATVQTLEGRLQSDSQRISLLANGTQGQFYALRGNLSVLEANLTAHLSVIDRELLHVSGLGRCVIIDPSYLDRVDYSTYYVLVAYTPRGFYPLVCPKG